MSLDRTDRYAATRVGTAGEHAVVIGASMAGLLAARVLADAYERVSVIERDSLPDGAAARRGVPQARHLHILHEAGRATMEDLFPGFGEAVTRRGGLTLDLASELEFFAEGGFLADGPRRRPMVCASRPLIEAVTRERLAAHDRVRLRTSCQFIAYQANRRAVEGVVIREAEGGETVLDAELVVDATGRSSRTPTWLADHGYRAPPTQEVTVDLAYSTAAVERPTGDRRAVIALPTPPRTRGGGLLPVEDDRWLVTLGGFHGDHPPTDEPGFVDFAGALPIPDIERVLAEHRIRSDEIHHYPFPATRRHRYEALDRFPAGLLVIGDAIASFNPIYGQGMSVAALEALELHDTLAAGGRRDLGTAYFERIAPIVDDAWSLATSADFRYPQTTGPRPWTTPLVGRYLARLTRAAQRDPQVADDFIRVISMERRPTTLIRPRLLRRVLLDGGPSAGHHME